MATTISVTSTIITSTHIYKADDVTDYSAVTYFVDSKSVLKLEGPLATLYNNTNFASPDFNYPGTLTKSTVIPLISGSIPQGAYTLTTTTRVTKACPIIDVSLASNYILVDLALLDNFVAGQSIVLAGGLNAGTYEIQSVSSNAFGTILTLVETLASDTDTGNVTFDEEIITVDAYTYCYTAPSPVITMTADCTTARLSITNDSDYAITCEGQSVQPTTVTPVLTLDSPTNSSGIPVYAQATSSLPAGSTYYTTELWTQTWIATLATTLVYELPSGLFINTSVTKATSLDVVCDDSLCCMSTCLQNATNTFLAAAANTSNLNLVLNAIVAYNKILGAFMMYSVGVRCGNTTIIDEAIANMKSYLADTDCCNNCSDSGVSTQIVAIYTVTVSGNTLIVQSGDAYIDITETVVGDVTTATFTINVAAFETLISTYINANTSIITDIVNAMGLKTRVAAVRDLSTDTAVLINGDTTTGSPVLSNVTFAAGIDAGDIQQGEPIYHTTLGVGAYIVSIAANGDITCSQNFTTTASITSVVIASFNLGLFIVKHKRVISGNTSYLYWTSINRQNSIDIDSTTGAIDLVNDLLTPGNNYVYSTNSVGSKGWQAFQVLLGAAVLEDSGAGPTTIPTGSSVTGATLTLDPGSYLMIASCKIVRTTANDQIFVKLLDGASQLYSTAVLIDSTYNPNENFCVVYPYTSASAITLNFTFEGITSSQVNGLRERCLSVIRIA